MNINNLSLALPLPKRKEKDSLDSRPLKRWKMDLLDLPQDCWLEIFKFLDDHRAAALTCKVWNHYFNFIYIEKVAEYRKNPFMTIFMPQEDLAQADSSFKCRKMNPFSLPENCCWEIFRFLGDHRAAAVTCKVWNSYLNFSYIDNIALSRKDQSMMVFMPLEDFVPSKPLLESERMPSISGDDDHSIRVVGAHCLSVLQKTYEQVCRSLHYPYKPGNFKGTLPSLDLSPTAARVINGNLIRFTVQVRGDLCRMVDEFSAANLEKLNNLVTILEPTLAPLGVVDEEGVFVIDEERLEELEEAESNWDDLDEYVMNLSEVEIRERSDAIREWFHASPELREFFSVFDYNDLDFTLIPPEIFLFTELDSINFGDNKVIAIPSEIEKLSKLRYLTVSNQLSELPGNLSACVSLQTLYCGENRLSSIPKSICNLSHLQELNLEQNQLTSLPSNFGNLKSLEELNLSHNRLENGPWLPQLTKLKILNLSNNRFSKFPDGMGNLINLERLNFARNHLAAVPVEGRNWTKLRILDLSENRFSFDGNRAFPPELVPRSEFSEEAVLGMQGLWPSLQELRLANNSLSQIPPIIEHLIFYGSRYPYCFFDLSDNNIRTIPHWLVALPEDVSARKFDFSGNDDFYDAFRLALSLSDSSS